MELIGQIENRNIYYGTPSTPGWMESLPQDNWLAFVIADEANIELLSAIAKASLDKGVVYMTAVGKAGTDVDDIFDIESVMRAIEKNEAPDGDPMTVWFTDDLEGGFWFSTCTAPLSDPRIERIICIDVFDKGEKEHLKTLIDKINHGWLPSDNNNE